MNVSLRAKLSWVAAAYGVVLAVSVFPVGSGEEHGPDGVGPRWNCSKESSRVTARPVDPTDVEYDVAPLLGVLGGAASPDGRPLDANLLAVVGRSRHPDDPTFVGSQ